MRPRTATRSTCRRCRCSASGLENEKEAIELSYKQKINEYEAKINKCESQINDQETMIGALVAGNESSDLLKKLGFEK